MILRNFNQPWYGIFATEASTEAKKRAEEQLEDNLEDANQNRRPPESRLRSDEEIGKIKSDIETLLIVATLKNADNDHALYVKGVFDTLLMETLADEEQLSLQERSLRILDHEELVMNYSRDHVLHPHEPTVFSLSWFNPSNLSPNPKLVKFS